MGHEWEVINGMNLRDYFAGQVLTQLIDISYWDDNAVDDIAARCYSIADAMLREREQRSNK
jgi:hypothetical protein